MKKIGNTKASGFFCLSQHRPRPRHSETTLCAIARATPRRSKSLRGARSEAANAAKATRSSRFPCLWSALLVVHCPGSRTDRATAVSGGTSTCGAAPTALSRALGLHTSPVGEITENTDDDCQSKTRPIDLIDSPRCHRSQISARCSVE